MARTDYSEEQIQAGSPLQEQLAVASHYDKVWAESGQTIGESWETWPFFQMSPGAHRYGLEALGKLAGKRVLDLGCGAGYSAVELAQAGAIVTAVDLSAQALAATKTRAEGTRVAERVATVRSSVEQLPFADETFDLVFAQNFLMHVSTKAVGAEAWRVLKPGGKAVFIEPLAYHPLVRLYRKLFSSYKDTRPRWCTQDDLKKLAAPFSKVETRTFYLLSVLTSANFVQTRPKLLKPAWTILNGADELLTRFIPATRRLCWVTVLTLTK